MALSTFRKPLLLLRLPTG